MVWFNATFSYFIHFLYPVIICLKYLKFTYSVDTGNYSCYSFFNDAGEWFCSLLYILFNQETEHYFLPIPKTFEALNVSPARLLTWYSSAHQAIKVNCFRLLVLKVYLARVSEQRQPGRTHGLFSSRSAPRSVASSLLGMKPQEMS